MLDITVEVVKMKDSVGAGRKLEAQMLVEDDEDLGGP